MDRKNLRLHAHFCFVFCVQRNSPNYVAMWRADAWRRRALQRALTTTTTAGNGDGSRSTAAVTFFRRSSAIEKIFSLTLSDALKRMVQTTEKRERRKRSTFSSSIAAAASERSDDNREPKIWATNCIVSTFSLSPLCVRRTIDRLTHVVVSCTKM